MPESQDEHDKELAKELAWQTGENDAADEPRLLQRIETARAYLEKAVKGQKVPAAVMDDCIVSVAADLWQAKDARNGIMGLADDAGIEPFHVSSDPLRTARPKLRAVGIPLGMGIA